MIRRRDNSPSLSIDHLEPEPEPARIKRSRAVLAKAKDKCVYDPWRGGEKRRHGQPENETIKHLSSNGNHDRSSIENRLSQVEDSLARIESLLVNDSSRHHAALPPSIPLRHTEKYAWSYLITQLPPVSLAQKLLRNYFVLDSLLRYTHQPSYQRRFRRIYSTESGRVKSDIDHSASSYLASLCLTMAIGTTLDHEDSHDSSDLLERLISLHHRFYEISETILPSHCRGPDPEFAYYHLHSLMIRTQRALMDHSSSLPQTWFEQGKIANTALFLGFHQDPDDLEVQISPFWKEMRRRIWWLLAVGHSIIIEKLRLPTTFPPSNVQKPVLIPDDDFHEDITQPQLDDQSFISRIFSSTLTGVVDTTPPEVLVASTGKTAAPEWAFIDAKIDSTRIVTEISKMFPHPSSQNSQLPDITVVDDLIDQLDAQRPPHLSFEILSTAQTRDCPLTAPDQPPWILPQACVCNTGKASVTLNTYQRYLSLSPDAPNAAQTVQHALTRSLAAAHRLLISSEIFVWHITFRWTEGKSLFSWNTGSKIFAAGVIVALAAIREGPKNGGWRGWMGDLQSAEGLLKVLSDHASKENKSQRSTCESADSKALTILRQLHERAKSQAYLSDVGLSMTTRSNDEEKLLDPYTSHDMSRISTFDNAPSQANMSKAFRMAENYALEELEAFLTQVYPSIEASGEETEG
ncbi:hypothetical protein I302_104644 [Kwoniella bestiolae CBS 10118]|uniref:Transcription factor domain-containing protein n=1 Tax=Kwoniella bestiolae CBS 10118 TaxID=1296100 RepID=A0A1B9GBW8_9TREE|nr:hypothetical protein I302_03354 [Kwoniella bestiolae CBS 10118]OCF28495.1 hypothetical protein I302_03354 [Kwoniella bestiolae CBS 10118]